MKRPGWARRARVRVRRRQLRSFIGRSFVAQLRSWWDWVLEWVVVQWYVAAFGLCAIILFFIAVIKFLNTTTRAELQIQEWEEQQLIEPCAPKPPTLPSAP